MEKYIIIVVIVIVCATSILSATVGQLEKQPMLQMNFSSSDSTDVLSVEDIACIRKDIKIKVSTLVRPYVLKGAVVSYVTVSHQGIDCDNEQIKKAIEANINWSKLPKAVGEVRIDIRSM